MSVVRRLLTTMSSLDHRIRFRWGAMTPGNHLSTADDRAKALGSLAPWHISRCGPVLLSHKSLRATEVCLQGNY